MTDRSPMEDIFAEVRGMEPPPPKKPVHARVLELPEGDGVAQIFACWSDPGGPAALHRDVRDRVEAALLAHVSRSRMTLTTAGAPPLRSLRLAMFPEMDAGPAVRAFGFTADTDDDDVWKQSVAHLRSEAHLIEADVADVPASRFRARVSHAAALDGYEQALKLAMAKDPEAANEVWGARPGAPYARLATAVGLSAEPSVANFAKLESHIVRHDPGVLRMSPPLTLQAFADAACVVMAEGLRTRTRPQGKKPTATIQWAVCEDDQGTAPPPLVRVAGTDHGGALHIPIALEILRWCVMPLHDGEVPPPFAEWLADCIADLGA